MHRPRVTDIISVPFEFRACFFPSNLSSVTIKNFSPGFCPAAHASKIHSPELSVTYPTPQSEVCHPAKLPPNPIIPYMTAASRTWLPRMVWPCIHPIRIGAGFWCCFPVRVPLHCILLNGNNDSCCSPFLMSWFWPWGLADSSCCLQVAVPCHHFKPWCLGVPSARASCGCTKVRSSLGFPNISSPRGGRQAAAEACSLPPALSHLHWPWCEHQLSVHPLRVPSHADYTCQAR